MISSLELFLLSLLGVFGLFSILRLLAELLLLRELKQGICVFPASCGIGECPELRILVRLLMPVEAIVLVDEDDRFVGSKKDVRVVSTADELKALLLEIKRGE